MAIRSDVVGSLLRPPLRIEDRVDDEAVALQVALSPQCGFASTMEGNAISPERGNRPHGLEVRRMR